MRPSTIAITAADHVKPIEDTVIHLNLCHENQCFLSWIWQVLHSDAIDRLSLFKKSIKKQSKSLTLVQYMLRGDEKKDGSLNQIWIWSDLDSFRRCSTLCRSAVARSVANVVPNVMQETSCVPFSAARFFCAKMQHENVFVRSETPRAHKWTWRRASYECVYLTIITIFLRHLSKKKNSLKLEVRVETRKSDPAAQRSWN